MSNTIYGYNNKILSKEQLCAGVGPGWKSLVEGLVDDLFKLGWDGHVFQVKEKFGGLRFYIGHGTTEIFDRIGKAETDSFKICEVCGESGKPRHDRSWIKTLCDKHAEE